MRIAYIGHSHHRKTGSTRFFLELLEELGTVDVYWDEGWHGEDNVDLKTVAGSGYDWTVLFQTERHAKFLNDSGRKVLFVPMYDSCLPFSESYWRELTKIDILCFCRTLFERLRRWGLRARYAQFFPDPAQFTVDPEPQYAGFFWQRRQELQWETLRSLVRDSRLSWINLHQVPDLHSSPVTVIPKREQESYRLRFSEWSEDKSTYDDALRQAGIYFAPRLYEGIGMSFLEAMAMGKAIVAPDNPTMNEYLTHNVNGYLFNPEDPGPVGLERFREMGKMARETIERGRPRWLQSREELGHWLLKGTTPKRRCPGARRNSNTGQISVISLSSPNSGDLDQTCLSIAAQNHSNIEHVVVSRLAPTRDANAAFRYVQAPRRVTPSEIMNKAAWQASARAMLICFSAKGALFI